MLFFVFLFSRVRSYTLLVFAPILCSGEGRPGEEGAGCGGAVGERK